MLEILHFRKKVNKYSIRISKLLCSCDTIAGMEPQRIRPKIVNTNSSNGRAVRNNNANTPAAGSSVKPTVKNSGKNAGTDQSPLEPIVEKPRKRRGLAALAIILFILLLGAAATSFYFYNKDKSDTSDLRTQKANLQNQVNQLQGANAQAAKAAAANTNAIQIKEWGVQFTPSSNTKDILYFTVSDTAFFTTQALLTAAYPSAANASLNTDNFCSFSEDPIGQVVRGKAGSKDPHSGGTTIEKNPTAIKIGDYYYVFVTPQAACSPDKTVDALESKITTSLTADIKTLKAIPTQ